MPTWDWNGARWWKFDFHTHSPASEDYGKGPDQASHQLRTPSEWLLDYMRAGVDCVAVTDHNSGSWIDKLAESLKLLKVENHQEYRPLHLFPAVEVSVNGGIHVLAILDASKTSADIDSLLGAVGFSGTKGSAGACTERSLIDVIEQISRLDGLAIPAHVDGPSGMFGACRGTTLDQVLANKEIVAIELVDRTFQKPQLYTDRRVQWTEILGSDAHHPRGATSQRFPGSHFTWIKMSTPSLDGLRLALLDGELSTRRSDQVATDPNLHAANVVESIEVTQTRYMGRARSFQLRFGPWLNAIIGGRGTGKSSIVEFLRAALRRSGELPAALAEDFGHYQRQYGSRNDDGLLTPATQLVVAYRKDSTRYRIRWTAATQASEIQVCDAAGNWTTDPGEVAQRFPVRLFSQKQVFELAKDPLALLRIIDESAQVDRRTLNDRVKSEESRYMALRLKCRELDVALADESRLKGELEDVKRKLLVFEVAEHAKVLSDYQKLELQRNSITTWEDVWSEKSREVRALAAAPSPEALSADVLNSSDPVEKDLNDLASAANTRFNSILARLESVATDLDREIATWREQKDTSPWRRSLDEAIKQYGDLCKKLADEGVGEPTAYGGLVKRRREIESKLKSIEARRKERDAVELEASQSLGALLKARRDLTSLRQAFVSEVLRNNKYVRINVVPYGAKDTVEPELRRLLQREDAGFEKDIGRVGGDAGLLGDLYSGSSEAVEVEKQLGQLKHSLTRLARGDETQLKVADRRFAAHVARLPPEALDRLMLWYPEDSLDVEYSTKANGTDYRSIHAGSPGQKTAALLAFLLSYGDEPVILDQPEDDLDNNLIYELIVSQIRRIKSSRQVIVVTHNANVVVNGDAELIVSLVAKTGETHTECCGSLQEEQTRDSICAIMEGGREAFEQRYRRIALDR